MVPSAVVAVDVVVYAVPGSNPVKVQLAVKHVCVMQGD